MVAARQRFLNTGVYDPVADTLSTILFEAIEGGAVSGARSPCCLDAGCGEGYYLDYLLNDLRAKQDTNALNFNPGFIGLDISKEAIVAAAKRNKDITWVVGTNRLPPIIAGSIDIIFCIFGFHSFQGFYNVLPVGGKLLLVEPGPDHLQELRQVTYPQMRKTAPNKLDDAFAVGFKQVDEQILRFNTPALPNKSLKDLLLMTPHFFRATQKYREAAEKLDEVSLTVDITFRSLEKTKAMTPRFDLL